MQHPSLSATLPLPVQVLVDLRYPLLFAALLLAWSSIRCIYEKFPISFPTFFFSAGTSPRDKCWAETVVHPVLLWRMALFNSQNRNNTDNPLSLRSFPSESAYLRQWNTNPA
jgi:hypothetical protein